MAAGQIAGGGRGRRGSSPTTISTSGATSPPEARPAGRGLRPRPGQGRAGGAASGATPYADMGAMLARSGRTSSTSSPRWRAPGAGGDGGGGGVGIIVQKPFAPRGRTASPSARLADGGGPLLVHENFRFQTPMRGVRALIDKGAIGRPSFARISFRTGFDVYRNQPYPDRAAPRHSRRRHPPARPRPRLPRRGRPHLLRDREHPGGHRRRGHRDDAARDRRRLTCVVDAPTRRREPDPFPETLLEIEGDAGALRLRPAISSTVGGRAGSERRGRRPRSSLAEPALARRPGKRAQRPPPLPRLLCAGAAARDRRRRQPRDLRPRRGGLRSRRDRRSGHALR